jgi:4-amino-4-deoxy-L-arabinose transferase-like glycosyltransferase
MEHPAVNRPEPAGERRSLSAPNLRPLRGPALFALAAGVFVWAAARAVTADLEWLLRIVPDDTFYYLQIAKNLARDGRSTFDGSAPTNGYHPLWMFLLTGLAALVDDRVVFMRSAITLALVLHVGSSAAVYAVVKRLVDPGWGWVAAACWLINPLTFLIAVQATEASVYGASALGFLLVHLRVVEARMEGRRPSWRLAAWYGLALGLLCLARTDGAIVAALAIAWLAWPAISRPGHRLATGAPAIAALAVVIVTVMPWWIFSFLSVGTLVQDSGAMKTLWASDQYPGLAGRLENLSKTVEYFTRYCIALMTVWNWSSASFTLCALALSAAPLLTLVKRSASLQARVVAGLLLWLGALTLTYGFAVVERQVWWLTVPCLTLMLVQFATVPWALRTVSGGVRLERAVQPALVILAILLLARWHVKDRALYPWQPDVRRSQLAIEAQVPAPERIGAFNAGIPGYFGAGRVVALDGLVNHVVRTHWAGRRLDEYVASEKLRYIADEARVLEKARRFSRTPLELELLASFPLHGWPTGQRHLWRVVAPTDVAHD